MMSVNRIALAVVLCATVAAGVRHLHLDNEYMVNVDITGTDEARKIVLELMVNTTGWVGFGISNTSSMVASDLVIGGYGANQSSYGLDYTGGDSNGAPIVDPIQNWEITGASEAEGQTTLKVERLLTTNDPKDWKIEDGDMHVLWSFGATDDITTKHTKRGSKQLNLFTADDTNGSGITAVSVGALLIGLVAAMFLN